MAETPLPREMPPSFPSLVQVAAAWVAVRGSQTIDGRMTVKEKVFRPRGRRENGRCQRQRDQ